MLRNTYTEFNRIYPPTPWGLEGGGDYSVLCAPHLTLPRGPKNVAKQAPENDTPPPLLFQCVCNKFYSHLPNFPKPLSTQEHININQSKVNLFATNVKKNEISSLIASVIRG